MSRYDDMSEQARFYLENWDEIDLAEMCASLNARADQLERAIARVRDMATAARTAGAKGITWEALDTLLTRPASEITVLSDTVISHTRREAPDVDS